jgi:hypothetical protein
MTGFLGDYFPQDKKDESAERSIAPGLVIRYFSNESIDPKMKKVILLAKHYSQEKFMCSFINTLPYIPSDNSIPEYVVRNQTSIVKCKNPFLDYDSFVDLANPFFKPVQEIFSLLSTKQEHNHGLVHEECMNRFLDVLCQSKSLSIRTKKEYGIFQRCR